MMPEQVMSGVPAWAKGTIAILSFLAVATNGFQYFGVSAPVKRDFAAVESREVWCQKQLAAKDKVIAEKDKLLEACWTRECRP